MKVYKVLAKFDPDANVWFIYKSDVPGLHVEAKSLDELRKELDSAIPYLLEDAVKNSRNSPCSVPVELLFQEQKTIAIGC
ncbi:MAG: DUF1902 domain-containing protein [Xanthomonadales bacterium]|nr:DUF1902 domain-containing protein [Xanthomonadales bacterium]